ncbi:hypothetical protein D3C77_594170 [compost metagenome]
MRVNNDIHALRVGSFTILLFSGIFQGLFFVVHDAVVEYIHFAIEQADEGVGVRAGGVSPGALLMKSGLAPSIHAGCSLISVCVRNYHHRLGSSLFVSNQWVIVKVSAIQICPHYAVPFSLFSLFSLWWLLRPKLPLCWYSVSE